MDPDKRRIQIIKEMSKIESMEKGRITAEYRDVYRDGRKLRLGPYYKHQRWEDGRNISRRVSLPEVESLEKAVNGYHRFKELSEEYIDIMIGMTRERGNAASKKKQRS